MGYQVKIYPANIPTHAALGRICIAAASGRCASTLDLDRLRKRIDDSNTFLPMDKRGFPLLSTCRHRWDWTRITRWRPAKLEKSVQPLTRCATWKRSLK